MSTKFPNLIEVSKMLRSNPATGWESIVAQSAEWIESDAAQRVSWEKAERDLSVLLPARIRKRLGGVLLISGSGLHIAVSVALAERAAGKPLDALRTPDEIKTALGICPSTRQGR